MAGDNSQTMQFNVKGTMSGNSLANILLPHLITAIESNAAFRNAIVNAIMPAVRAQAATTAAQTAGGKRNPKTGL